MQKIGVNLENLWVIQPDTAEDALNAAELAAESGGPSVVVIDSIAALSPKAEIEGEIGDSIIGVNARLMGQFMRKVVPACKKNDTTLFCVNQIRYKIGVMYGSPETRPGGNALRFFASQVIRTKRSGDVVVDGEVTGAKITCDIKKNKVAAPARSAEIQLLFGEGFSQGISLLDEAVACGIIDKAGAWYSYNGEQLGQGAYNIGKLLEDNEALFEEVYTRYRNEKDGTITHENVYVPVS
jgi:recombination protein RecA